MDEQERKKIENDAHFAGQLQALEWVLKILDGAGKLQKKEIVNLKHHDRKCDEIREKIFALI